MEPLDAPDVDIDAAQLANAASSAAATAATSAATPLPTPAAGATAAWPRAYSSALSKSMKAMINTNRLRRHASTSGTGDGTSTNNNSSNTTTAATASRLTTKSDAEHDEQALKQLLLAIESNEPHEILAQVAQSPHALRMSNEVSHLRVVTVASATEWLACWLTSWLCD